MVALAIIAIVAITLLRPAEDNTALIVVVLGFVATTLGTVLTYLKTQETHLSVNSRMDQLLSVAQRQSRAEGLAAGKIEGAAAANQRTDDIAKQ